MICKNVFLPAPIIFSILLLFCGCFDEEEPGVHGSTTNAENALMEAEAALEAAGFPMTFDEPGELIHLENFIPDPDDLGDPQKLRDFEEAIKHLNTVLSELEQEAGTGYLGSTSDRALVHLYLGFAYVFDAMSRLLISDDPAETFVIGGSTDATGGSWYSFGVSPAVKLKLSTTEDPLDYPLAFTVRERQAVIDATDLIDDAVVKPKAPDIQPQLSSVRGSPYSGYAIWHFQRAATLFGDYEDAVGDALEDFNEQIDAMRTRLQGESETWGFTYSLPPWRE